MATREQVIYTDNSELNLLLKGKAGRESHLFQASKVQSVSFLYEKKFLRGQIRRISISCGRLGNVFFDETDHPKYFEEYLKMLREWCAKNRVTFHDFPDKA